MVNTRSTTRKELENKEKDSQFQLRLYQQPTSGNSQKDDQAPTASQAFDAAGSSVKAEYRLQRQPAARTGARSTSTSSSLMAKRKQLELEMAKEKARIQMDLIDKKFQADLANLMDENKETYSPNGDSHNNDKTDDVNKWLEQSQPELEPPEMHAPDYGYPSGEQGPPAADDSGPANRTVQMLASALQNLTAVPTNSGTNNNLLSRMCTPRDLPNYSGDPLEWLQFKQAYEESTKVCGFTPKENLWRLRKCLHGPAKEAVSALMISATSPDIVIKTLELLFGNADTILSKIIQGLKKLQPMSNEYNKEIVSFSVKVQNFIAAVHAVGREEYIQGVNIVSIILSKLPTVLISKWSDYSFTLIQKGKKARLEILSDFLNEEAIKISTTAIIHVTEARAAASQHHCKGKPDNNNTGRPFAVLVQSARSENKCLFCQRAMHILTECKQFKRALRKDRWRHVKRHGVCYKCLVSRHDRETCPAAVCDRDGCGEAHHRLLHYVRDPSRDPRAAVPDPGAGAASAALETSAALPAITETVTHINSARKVLLKVVPINIHGPNGIISTTALLDDGSTITLMCGALAARAGLRGRTEAMRVSGAWSGSDLLCHSTVLSVVVSDKNNSNISTINVRSVDNLKLPDQDLCSVDCSQYAHLQNLKHELLFSNNNNVKPEVLIGQDNHHLLVPIEMCIGKRNEPSATRTTLGWSLHGVARAPPPPPPLPRGARAPRHSVLLCAGAAPAASPAQGNDENELRELHDEVRRSFLLDSLGVNTKTRQNSEDVRALAQLERSAALEAGRWCVGLPWRDEGCTLPDSYDNALNRLKGVEKKMLANPAYAARYSERIDHLLVNDFAEEEKDTRRTPRTWFLPHFGVDNPNKNKLRLVFDAAAKSRGMSLNDYLLQGPDLLASLFGIMVRFRENRIAVAGDIKDMFLRVKIRDEDQNSLRFLWRPHPEQPVKTYKMTSLIFGANCSPFIAQYVKNRNAERFTSAKPAAVDAICSQHYMDDYLDSFPDEATAIQMVRDIVYIHKEGGFEMRNWTSNSVAVLDSVPKETLGTVAVRLKMGQQYEGERTLGLIWYPANDELGFDLSFKRIPEDVVSGEQVPTKRIMLRVIMSIYDVFGFLSPFTIQGKIMLQNLWRLNIGWDEEIPNNILNKWKDWIALLKIMSHVRVPRCYLRCIDASETEAHVTADSADLLSEERPPAPLGLPSPAQASTPLAGCYEITHATTATSATTYGTLQLHVFCDASTKAMCAVAYWRWTCNNKVFVAFVASKCRVAPVKPLTVPRLELQAALLAARLADTIIKEHKLRVSQRIFWSDSTTVLHWINNDARNYKTFVANRLGEIDELSNTNEWRYVPTKLNVADIATRETYDDATFRNEWLRGPTFLRGDESSWPHHVLQPTNDANIIECVNIVANVATTQLAIPEPKRFSSWLRLLRSTVNVLKFIRRCRKHTYDDCQLMEQAERLLMRHVQGEVFGTEVGAIKEGKCIPRSSRILSLSPYLDEHGILRCRGRIGAAFDVSTDTKNPIILDGQHHVTRLLVRHFHVKAAHGNQETVLNILKQRYWIVKLRPTIKHVAAGCMFCRIKRAKPEVPVMGDLPPARMAHHQRPFTHCGVDLFGPMEVVVGRRREKRYGVIFTCLTVRAIHLEIVHSLTTDSLIMALRRMATRRGWPRHLYSDNGTNLRGADTELKKSIQELDDETLKREAANNGTQWTFIPPASPHWGGAWERLIRSVKASLGVVLKERAPKDEVLATFMSEVENIVNSRPLTHVSVEPGSNESLTPNHFLLGTSSSLPTAGVFDDSDLHLRKQWRKSQRLADMYWRRWVSEYLPELIPRKRWNEEREPLKVGDLVLVVDPGAPRNVWQKAVVQQVFPGKDGRVRLVEVRTKTGTLRRSAARVAKIPLSEEC